MIAKTPTAKKEQGGFALLLTLLVVTVLISIGLSVLTLSIQQVRLASTARDSEIAFQAANAGMECAHYWRRRAAGEMEQGDNDVSIGCFLQTQEIDSTTLTGVTGGSAYEYQYQFTWGTPARCSVVTTIVGVADLPGSGLVIPNMTTLLPGFPDGPTKECEPGTRCSVISVEGYNRSCDNIDTFGTVQREVLLQL